MRSRAFLLLAATAGLAFACGKSEPPVAAASRDPLVSARPFEVDVPPGYDAAKPAPLLLALHGFGDTGESLGAKRWVLSSVASAHGMLVAHPDGTPDRERQRFWDATDACCNFEAVSLDDVAYLTAVIDDVAARYRVDPKRVWVAGISNGGFMAHRLACDRSNKIAAIVSLAGATWLDGARCQPDSPVSVLEIHGGDDHLVRYEGGTRIRGGRALTYPSVDVTVTTSASKDGCTGVLTPTGSRLGFDGEDLTRATETATWSGCPAGIDVERWKMNGSRHVPPVTRAWAEDVVGWLEKHPKR
jgi:polyhydroxybutyrate depolymerase